MRLSLDGSTELEHLRRLAQVARQLLQAEATYVRTRDRHDLLVLRDTTHQLRRLLEQHRRRWGRPTMTNEIEARVAAVEAEHRATLAQLEEIETRRQEDISALQGAIERLTAENAALLARAAAAEARARELEETTATLHLTREMDEALERIVALEAQLTTRGVCRVCGCTDDLACEGSCYWVEPDLCSACAPGAERCPCGHPPHLGPCTRRNGGTANPCPCLRDTLPIPTTAALGGRNA